MTRLWRSETPLRISKALNRTARAVRWNGPRRTRRQVVTLAQIIAGGGPADPNAMFGGAETSWLHAPAAQFVSWQPLVLKGMRLKLAANSQRRGQPPCWLEKTARRIFRKPVAIFTVRYRSTSK
jgi:hypothetical protein